MITRAVAAGIPARWATGDEVYGADPDLRVAIATGGWAMCSPSGPTAPSPPRRHFAGGRAHRSLPRRAWRRLSAGAGAKGQRRYSWALVEIIGDTDSGHHHLLVRRNDKTGELAYYRCYSPDPATLHDYVRVAGRRWKIEESFQTGKGLAGLDEHQVRTWTSWHRWVTLAMLAHAFLTVTTAAQRRIEKSDNNTVKSLITLTVNEFRRLFLCLLLRPLHTVADIMAWSTWRRKHQARARACHYHKQHQQQ